MYLDELNRRAQGLEALLQRIDHVTRSAVAGIDHQLERLKISRADIAEQVFDVSVLA